MTAADHGPIGLVDLDCPSCGAPFAPADDADAALGGAGADGPARAARRCDYCGGPVLAGASGRRRAGPPAQRSAPDAARPLRAVPADGARRGARWGVVVLVLTLVATGGVAATVVGGLGALTGATPAAGGTSIGTRVLAFGRPGSAPGFLDDPRQIAVGPDGTIWVADGFDGRVAAFDAQGSFLREIRLTEPGSPNVYIAGLAVGADGDVHVSAQGRIRSFSGADGRETGDPIGGPGVGYGALTTSPGGELVALQDGAEGVDIVVLDAGGTQLRRIERIIEDVNPDDPTAVLRAAVNGSDDVFVLSSAAPQVYRYTAAGRFADRFGTEGVEPGRLRFPLDVAVDAQGRVVLADGTAVEVFTPDGEYVGGIPLAGEGAATAVAVDRAGAVYVLTNAAQVLKFALRS